MKRLYIYIKLLMPALMLAMAMEAWAQEERAVPGTPGQSVHAVRLYNSIREAEISPLNVVQKGPIIENMQGVEDKDEIEPKFIVPELTPDQNKNTPVSQVDEKGLHSFVAPPPEETEARLVYDNNADQMWVNR